MRSVSVPRPRTTVTAHSASAGAHTLSGKRRPVVLTVDDNPTLHDFYALAFERGYDHLWAFGGPRERRRRDSTSQHHLAVMAATRDGRALDTDT